MADTIHFSLVSPERELASADVEAVTIPGMEGDLTAMVNHAPFLTTLRPGVVRVTGGGADAEYVVTGGFAELSPESAAVLAEEAVERSTVDRAWIDDKVAHAQEALEHAPAEMRTPATQRVNDFKALGMILGV